MLCCKDSNASYVYSGKGRDYAGDRVERKSTSGNCQFLGSNLVSWESKRQSTIALSTAEAEYVSASLCATQMLWMKHQLEDYQLFEKDRQKVIFGITF